MQAALDRAELRERRAVEISLVVTPTPPTLGAPAEPTGRPILFDAPTPPEEKGQIVLAVDEMGGMSWHVPEPAPSGFLAGGPDPSRQLFVVPIRVRPPVQGVGEQGFLGALGRMLLRVFIYPLGDLVVGKAVEIAARVLEGKFRPYEIRSFTPANCQNRSAPRWTPADWNFVGSGRSLLFIHGGLSTASIGLGRLPGVTMGELDARYGHRLFAFDHPTTSEDPKQNASWFLQQVPAGMTLDLDILCHSRGGIVARELTQNAKVLCPRVTCNVGKVVFVGVPNDGTALLDGGNIVHLFDRLTSAISLLPPGFIAELLDGVILGVKLLAHGGLAGLRGLKALVPRGAYLQKLNAPGPMTTQYFAIAADYEPKPTGPLPQIVKMGAFNQFMDAVFKQEPNDLTVPTDGVAEPAGGGPGFPIPAANCIRFPAKEGVWHHTYFEASKTNTALVDWLT
ncbi:MAG: hypothetical protein ABSB58_06055 [Gemmatimonadales bacterium]